MKHFKIIGVSILIIGFSLLIPLSGLAADGSGGKTEQSNIDVSKEKSSAPAISDKKEKPEAQKDMPIYRPPLRGAPGGRLAGGTRGGGDGSLRVSALVPDHIGLTVQEQPSLYWFLSQPTSYPIELTVIEAQAIRPLIETRLSHVVQPGMQCIRLADYGVRLKTGVQYQWFVALVPDPEQRSKDIIAGGEIERVELQGGLRSELEKAGKTNAPHVYAEAGLWYDALGAVSELIVAAPGSAVYRNQRASLLQQVGLSDVAEYEMKR